MKATISAKELKAALKVLKAVSDTFQEGKGETVYGFNQDERGLWLQAVGGVFVSHFIGINVENFEAFVPVDAPTLSSLKFPVDEVVFESKRGCLKAKSGALDIELAVPAVQIASLKSKEVPLHIKFPTKPLIEALSFHCYGEHHNPLEAAKRPVRMSYADGQIHLQSFDKQVSAFNTMPFKGKMEGEVHLTPKPLKVVLDNVSDAEVDFGMTKQYWKVASSKLEVIYPNLMKPVSVNFDDIIAEMVAKPSIKISFASDHLSRTLNVLSPSVKAGKEENPKMHLFPKGNTVQVTIVSEKIRSMKFDLEGRISEDRIKLDDTAVALNYRYTREFVDNLGGDEVHFQYWKFQDGDAPLKGRAVSFYNEHGRYVIARITL